MLMHVIQRETFYCLKVIIATHKITLRSRNHHVTRILLDTNGVEHRF